MNSLNANFTTSGGFTGLEDKLVSVLELELSDAIVSRIRQLKLHKPKYSKQISMLSVY